MKHLHCIGISIITIGCITQATAGVIFEPRAKLSTINHVYAGGWEHFVGGGMATFDCNDDSFPDAFLAGGENPSQLIMNTTQKPGAPITFNIALESGTEFKNVTGAYPLNFDSDEHIDLFIMRVGENKLLRGLGNCKFEIANKTWSFESSEKWTTSFSATWEDDANLPTLAVGNYVDRKDPEGPFGTCDTNMLYRPNAELYTDPTILEPGYCALSMLISDWKRTGKRDLRISNDRHYYLNDGHEQMYSLAEERFFGAEDGWKTVQLWGMGIASQDLNTDGKPDVMLTSMGDQLLQFYNQDGTFTNAPFSIGTYSQRPYFGDDGRPSTGWHAEFADIDNDGLPDLFIAKGNVDQMPGNAMKDPNNLLIQNKDGIFTEVGLEAGVADTARSRGATITDFNLDGRLDIAVINRRAPFEIYENKSENTGNFISVKISRAGINPNAVGAWVTMRDVKTGHTLSQEITIGGGHASGESGPVHFGLGTNKTAQIQITWPDGDASEWLEVEANQFIEVSPTKEDNSLTAKPLNF